MVHNWVYKPQHANCNWMHCKLETHNASIGLECISAAHAHLKNLIQCILYLSIGTLPHDQILGVFGVEYVPYVQD